MKNNIIDFFCTGCKHEWQGLFVPLYCPNCEGVLGIAIVVGEEKDD